jgi:RhtB (resistance to homoserine/threonine) family protein
MKLSAQFANVLPLLIIFFVSLISPGPDFAITVKNSLIYSRRSGLLTALGIAIGCLFHISYTLLGLAILITKIPLLMHFIQYLGAGYLFYIGYKSLKSQSHLDKISGHHAAIDLKPMKAFSIGLLTNIFNPKIMLFCISLFSVLIPKDTSIYIKLILALIIFIETWLWFSFVAFTLSGKKTRAKFEKISHWVERITGVILIALAIKLLFSNLIVY